MLNGGNPARSRIAIDATSTASATNSGPSQKPRRAAADARKRARPAAWPNRNPWLPVDRLAILPARRPSGRDDCAAAKSLAPIRDRLPTDPVMAAPYAGMIPENPVLIRYFRLLSSFFACCIVMIISYK